MPDSLQKCHCGLATAVAFLFKKPLQTFGLGFID
jgi:hypothetical protein